MLSLVAAMRQYDEQEIWQRVGKDPSGQPFNSLLQLEIEQGKPRNPFINAGALVVCDMLQSRLSAPRQRMLQIVRQLSGVQDIAYDPVVARSEFEHSARNAAIARLMKSFGNFYNDVATVLQNYFHYCALKMNCVELAQTFLFLAHQGHAPHLGEDVVSPMQARQINALMATSGMYQNAGEFARAWGCRLNPALAVGSWRLSPRDGDCRLEPGTGRDRKFTGGRSGAGTADQTSWTVRILMSTLDPLFARPLAPRFVHDFI